MIKVLVVDDSEVDRKLISLSLNKHHNIEVVGTAENPLVAKDLILMLKPDVITLDLQMPGMDGLTFLSKLMKHFSIPVILVSAFTPKNSEVALNALDLGAIDVILKPGIEYSIHDFSKKLCDTVNDASKAIYVDRSHQKKESVKERGRSASKRSSETVSIKDADRRLIAIGSSTGGTRALEKLLRELPTGLPGIVIVQHMPPIFTKSFADRLNGISRVRVKEAEHGETIEAGTVYIAPGDHHTHVTRKANRYRINVSDGEKVQHQRPSVDVLFNSVAHCARENATGIILTGMGSDGADGLLNMRLQGAYTIGQDEDTCVVYGMPKAAYEAGAVTEQLPLQKIARRLIRLLQD